MAQPAKPDEADDLPNLENSPSSQPFQEMVAMVQTLASDCHGDTQDLLSLLRTLEALHRQIRLNLFEPSLPNTRKELYEILRDIDESGGWPYIERMKLQKFLQNFSSSTPPNTP